MDRVAVCASLNSCCASLMCIHYGLFFEDSIKIVNHYRFICNDIFSSLGQSRRLNRHRLRKCRCLCLWVSRRSSRVARHPLREDYIRRYEFKKIVYFVISCMATAGAVLHKKEWHGEEAQHRIEIDKYDCKRETGFFFRNEHTSTLNIVISRAVQCLRKRSKNGFKTWNKRRIISLRMLMKPSWTEARLMSLHLYC